MPFNTSKKKTTWTPQQLVDQVKHLYIDFTPGQLDQLTEIYSEDISFKDPIQELQGLTELRHHLEKLCGQLHYCRFDFIDQLVGNEKAFLVWDMHYAHPNIKSGAALTLRGNSWIHYHQKIFYQEDFYDLGAMLYEHLPLLGPASRWLKKRISQ